MTVPRSRDTLYSSLPNDLGTNSFKYDSSDHFAAQIESSKDRTVFNECDLSVDGLSLIPESKSLAIHLK